MSGTAKYRHLLQRQAYLRLLVLLTAASLCVTSVFSVVLSRVFSNYAVGEIAKVNRREIRHTAADMDSMIARLKVAAINMYADPDIHTWLSSAGDDPIAFVSATNKLTKFMSTEAFIDNVYLFNMRNRQIYETRYGLRPFERFDEQEALAFFQENRPTMDFACFEAGGKTYFAMKCPATPARVNFNGYIVLTLHLTQFQERFLSDDEDGDGVRTLLMTGDWFPFAQESDEALLPMLAQNKGVQTSGSFELSAAGQRYLVHYETVKNQDWTVFRLTHFSDVNRQIERFRNVLLISVFVLLCLMFALQFWYSRRALGPLSTLADKMQALLGRELTPDDARMLREYGVIERGIELLRGKVQLMDDSIGAHKDMIKQDYLKQWILSGRMNAAVREYLCAESDLLQRRKVYLAVLRIESYQQFRAEHDFIAMRQMKHAIGEAACAALAAHGYAAEAVDMGADSVTLLIGDDTGDADAIRCALSEVLVVARERLPRASLAAAMSLFGDEHGETRRSYAAVYEMSMLKFIWGSEKVYTDSDFDEYSRAMTGLPDMDSVEEIIQELRLGNLDKALINFDRLIAQLRTTSYTNCKLSLTLCIYMIFKAFSKQASLNDFSGIQSQLDRFGSISDAAGWIKSEIRSIAENIANARKTGKQAERVLEIVEYIANNLHNPLLSADDVADHVALSARYVRQIFKETFGVTLLDYILSKRIEKVCDLLKTTQLPVGDVMEQTGFLSKSHFFTAFKKATGVTPVQYRRDALDDEP